MLDFPSSPMAGTLYPDPPLIGVPQYVFDGVGWVASDSVAARKNYIINGAMQVSQENGTSLLNIVSGPMQFPVDQFAYQTNTGAYSVQQVAVSTPSGSPNRARATVTTADAAVGASDLAWIIQKIEGLRVADLGFGSSSAKTVTVRFGVKAPAGTYSFAIINNAVNRSYISEYVIASGEANTDVVRSITIPGDKTGTWLSNNGAGFEIRWGLMAGTTFQQAAGAWGTVNAVGSPNQFNFMGTVGNVFELFDVGLYEGNAAPVFVVPDYASELALCKRYWQPCLFTWGGNTTATGLYRTDAQFSVEMRAAPTATSAVQNGIGNGGFNARTFVGSTPRTGACQASASATVNAGGWADTFNMNARL